MLISKMPDGTPEIYATQQGEGATMGKNCVIVRCAGCNLQCNFCDTPYAWYWDGVKLPKNYHRYAKPADASTLIMEMSPKEVAECIRRVGTGVRRVVFTGGEPTIQQRSIIQVMDDIWASELDEEADWQFEIETNGTISLEYALAKELDNINCSPKMANSGNSLANRFKPEVIKDLMLCREKFGLELIFKFVVGKESAGKDLKEIRKWQIDCKVPSELIYLMPEGITADKITEGTRKLFEVAREHGYKLSTRLHILLWGNKRAV